MTVGTAAQARVPVRTTPLSASVARLDAAVPWRGFSVATEGGLAPRAGDLVSRWLLCREVLSDEQLLASWRDLIADHLRTEHAVRQVAAVVPAVYQLGHYADVVGWLGAALFHRERRVPSAAPDDLAFRLDRSGEPVHVTLLSTSFACLPDDPDADHPDAEVLPDEQALAARLRTDVVAHARRFDAAFRPGMRIGPHLRWGTVTDVLDSAPWSAGMLDDDEASGARTSSLLLRDAEPPLLAGSQVYRGADDRGRGFFSRRRHACCFAYRLPATEACFSCPRTSDAERCARAAQWPDEGPPP